MSHDYDIKMSETQMYLALREICAIIYYQSSLKDQDRWLKEMISEEILKPSEKK